MNKKIIIDANFPNETRVVLLSHNNNIDDIEYETAIKQQSKGNIYLAKVTRVEPSLQAAFIEYGADKSGFLPFAEIHPDYYNLLNSKKKLLSPIESLKEITLANITQDNIVESAPAIERSYNPIIDNEEIDLKAIEQLVDEKIQSEFNLEVLESDIETISQEQGNKEEDKEKQYKIQEVIKKGQVILVQVTKEERGSKGASFTTFLALAGKYCVLMPNTALQNGVSRKISNTDERKRLKNIISKITINNHSSSIIVRTAGAGCTTLDIKRDYNYLVKLWNKIREIAIKSVAPCFIHEEDGLIQKIIRDMFDHTVKEMMIQGDDAYQNAVKFMKDILPTEISKLKEYKNKVPIFTKFAIEEQLANLYQPVISLPSGGYIVINPTEALISIDVNSGRATSEKNIEETALKTNLEAAREIARQAKLRDLSGLLVVDFIDMYDTRNRRIVERSFREFLSRDRAKIQTANISQFGLLEMSRQRLRPSFLESNSSICSHCNGKGLVRADESNAMLILRTVENEIFNEIVDVVNVYANVNSVVYLLNKKRALISIIEEKYNLKLNFYVDSTATSDNFSIEKVKLPKKSNNIIVNNKPLIQNQSSNYQEERIHKNNHTKTKQKWKVTVNKSEAVNENSKNLVIKVDEETTINENNSSKLVQESHLYQQKIENNSKIGDSVKQSNSSQHGFVEESTEQLAEVIAPRENSNETKPKLKSKPRNRRKTYNLPKMHSKDSKSDKNDDTQGQESAILSQEG